MINDMEGCGCTPKAKATIMTPLQKPKDKKIKNISFLFCHKSELLLH
jgi:hypothetical protein